MTVLRLSKVELSGFKSFADETAIDVVRPLTAIVGPNGSGKSNILDSVLFAFGEQSPSRLRTGKMDDLIFGGAGPVKRQNFTSVKLTFVADFGENRGFRVRGTLADGFALSGNGKMFGGSNGNGRPVPDAPVTLERRLYRDGISEYILNGETVRLRDVDEFFGQFGMGRGSVISINQGEVERKILAKPDELRTWLVSACGIGLLMDQKRRTEDKLAETLGNIVRITDLSSGLEARVLELDAEKAQAENYIEMSGSLSALRRESLLRDIEDCFSELKKNREVVDEIRAQERKHADLSEARKNDAVRAEAALEEKRAAAEDCSGKLRDAEREESAAASVLDKLLVEQRMLAGQIAAEEAGGGRAASGIAADELRLAALKEEQEKLAEKQDSLATELAAAEKRAEEALAQNLRARKEFERASEQWAAADRMLIDGKNSLELARSAEGRLKISEEKRKLELNQGRESLSEMLVKSREAEDERELSYSLLIGAEYGEATLSDALAVARETYKSVYARRDAVRDEVAGVTARLDSLRALELEGEGFAPGKRVLLTDPALRERLGGARDFWHGLDFPSELACAVYLVLRGFEDAVEAGDLAAGCGVLSGFHASGIGMARIIASPGHEPAPARPEWWPQGVTRFFDVVHAGNGRLRRMYAETGEVAVCASADEAREVLAAEPRIARAVLADGSLIIGRDEVSGGAPGGGSRALSR